MSLNSSRLAIANALVSLLGTIQNPNTSTAIYQYVKLGATFDPGASTAWCDVSHMQGKGLPAGSGGNLVGWRIDDEVTFMLTTGVGPYETNDSTAQASMLTIQDILLPALHQHFQLPDSSNPTNAVQSVYSVLLQTTPDRSVPMKFPNGHVYLLWHVPVIVKQQYNVGLIQP